MALKTCEHGHMYSEKKHGAVCPYCSRSGRSSDTQVVKVEHDDITYLGEIAENKRVVGWLGCTEGPSKGKDYRIFPEKNFVGRSAHMNIRIVGDNNIADINHAIISYDSNQNTTMLLPGTSTQHVNVFDQEDKPKALVEPLELKPGTRFVLGETTLMFVALCGDNREHGFAFPAWQ
jgi:hypothetical protein